MTNTLNHDTKKLEETIMLICSNVDDPKNLGATKLNKICWKADEEYYIKTGKNITGGDYQKQPYGPVHKYINSAKTNLINKNRLKEEVDSGEYNPNLFYTLSPVNMEAFNPEEVAIILKHTADISKRTAQSISEESHDIIWESAVMTETLPMYAYLVSDKNDVTESDMEWAKQALQSL